MADAPATGAPAVSTAGAPAPRARRRWRAALVQIAEVAAIAGGLAAIALWWSVPDTAPLARANPRSTAFIELRRDQAARAGRELDVAWTWRPLGKISRYLRAAVVYAEDYKFYRHDGVDWAAIEDALSINLGRASFAVGGSTITQQLAKNLYLSPDRSLIRKLREMLIAYALEDELSKQRILELYLNVVEWGDGVFGAEAAARRWFGRSAQSLTPAEAVRLAIALPNPIARAPNVRSPQLTRKAVRIIRLLRMQGLLDATQERAALDQVGAPHEKVLPGRPLPPEPEVMLPEPPAVVGTPPGAEPAAGGDEPATEATPEEPMPETPRPQPPAGGAPAGPQPPAATAGPQPPPAASAGPQPPAATAGPQPPPASAGPQPPPATAGPQPPPASAGPQPPPASAGPQPPPATAPAGP